MPALPLDTELIRSKIAERRDLVKNGRLVASFNRLLSKKLDADADDRDAMCDKIEEDTDIMEAMMTEIISLRSQQPQVTHIDHVDRLEAKDSKLLIDKNETHGDFVLEKNVKKKKNKRKKGKKNHAND